MNWCVGLKPVFAMLAVNFALSLVNVSLKKILNNGTKDLVIIAYRQSISAMFLAPIAYFLERKSRPGITLCILCHLFFSALIGATLTLYLFLLGLKYTSTTFSCAFINMVPVNTFILALLFGIEKVSMKSKGGRAKMIGALVCIGGALILIFYKGISINNAGPEIHRANGSEAKISAKRWTFGSLLLTTGCLCWSSWFLMQSKIGRMYPCQYSSTTILSFFSAIQSAILSLAIDRDISIWVLKGKLQILSLVYTGIVGSGLCYVGMSWCVKEQGPVFTAAFTPFIQIFAAMFDFSILHEQIYLGSVVGSLVIVSGMYILLWGKTIEAKECKSLAAERDEKRTELDQI